MTLDYFSHKRCRVKEDEVMRVEKDKNAKLFEHVKKMGERRLTQQKANSHNKK